MVLPQEQSMGPSRVLDLNAIERIGLKQKYSLHTAKPSAMQPWGIRVLYLSNPTNLLLWHIAVKKQA
jgi:hypothetical protein